MAEEKSTRDVLLGAIDVLAERGWCRGSYEGRNGSVCVVGALRVAAVGDAQRMTYDSALRGATEALAAKVGIITFWNDDPSTTYGDIVDGLKRAAEASL